MKPISVKALFHSIVIAFPFVAVSQQTDTIQCKQQIDSLILICKAQVANSEFELALESISIAEKLALSLPQQPSASYARVCYNYGRIFHFKGDYAQAKHWYEKSMLLWETSRHEDDPDYASCLSNLAVSYFQLGQYSQAETLYLKTLKIREKTVGIHHIKYERCLINLANLYAKTGRYEDAESMYLRANGIAADLNRKTTVDYAENLNNLALLYMETSRYENALPLYLEAKNIWEQAGKDQGNYAACLNNLANLYFELGAYEQAEPYFLEAKNIREKLLGKEHPEYLQSLKNLAILCINTGDYEKAESILIDVSDLRKRLLGENHPDYANSLEDLAVLYEINHEYPKAETLHQNSLTIRKELRGKENSDYARNLQNLSNLYGKMGRYKEALPKALENLAILEKKSGKSHPDYASGLHNLAFLYTCLGKPGEAEPLYAEANLIYEKTFGKAHPHRLNCLADLADMYAGMGETIKAEPLFLEVATLRSLQLEKAILHLSEQELNKYLRLFSENCEHLLSFAHTTHNKESTLPGACYDNSLFYKGFLLHTANRIRHFAQADSAAMAQLDLLKSYKRRLAHQYSIPAIERQGVVALEAKANDLEKNLARTVSNYAISKQQIKWQEVQQKLKPADVAIELVRYKFFDKQQTDRIMYAALVLKPGMAQPQFVPLFEEKTLDSLLHTFGQRKADYVNSLYAVSERGVKPLDKPEKSLYELLWQPLENLLPEVKNREDATIYFSPIGLLHRINTGAIPINEDLTFSDRYRLVEMGSTRQLVLHGDHMSENQSAMLFGGIFYDADTTAEQIKTAEIQQDMWAVRSVPDFSKSDSKLHGDNWEYLKWTDKEVSTIQQILQPQGFQTQVLKENEGTEKLFKAIGEAGPSPRILHVATHGFFFPDPKAEGSRQLAVGSEPVFKISDHPMIRSGLLLAGANHAWSRGLGSKPLKPGMEDGILTAYEISQMNLSNTELVVLSACETGLGDIQGNEGVYGLQRAFKIAGAKYLVMSLWQVPDQETSVFMTTFYKNWLEGKMAIPDAFRTTQKEMRERFINPYQWAGFVLVE